MLFIFHSLCFFRSSSFIVCTMHVIRAEGIIGEKMLTFSMSKLLWSHMGFIELSTV